MHCQNKTPHRFEISVKTRSRHYAKKRKLLRALCPNRRANGNPRHETFIET